MKFKFLKLKKEDKNQPSLEAIRSSTFDTDLFWSLILVACLIVFVTVVLVGLKLLSAQYFESYKESGSVENYENLINIDRLKNVIDKRNEFINKEISLPRDPSL